MTLGWAQAAGGEAVRGRRTLTEAIRRATAVGQRWTTAMSEMLLGRALLLPKAADSAAAAAGSAAAAPDSAAAAEESPAPAPDSAAAAEESPAPAPDSAAAAEGSAGDPEWALAALRRAVALFVAEDDVGNVLACLFTGAQALLAAGRREEGVLLAVSVERRAARRGIFPGAADPAGSAALAGVDTSGIDPLDETAMITMLGTGPR
ncbi:hypothetical protein [Paractinoplanes atraurantiacus]|uniref:Uncharacterized protein n=1 Tax=Paractinoplanes atraurantiacus TaxID=1036182 RepID=A0A285FUA1_9ACTN|nr:hypothetical protein [Actinoplanes atraurantiacus]SNY14920.1 hypothetical protein SAMN05421748_1011244 [Actinoplanes atraurantiacus]